LAKLDRISAEARKSNGQRRLNTINEIRQVVQRPLEVFRFTKKFSRMEHFNRPRGRMLLFPSGRKRRDRHFEVRSGTQAREARDDAA
jgi:hypothetical protein